MMMTDEMCFMRFLQFSFRFIVVRGISIAFRISDESSFCFLLLECAIRSCSPFFARIKLPQHIHFEGLYTYFPAIDGITCTRRQLTISIVLFSETFEIIRFLSFCRNAATFISLCLSHSTTICNNIFFDELTFVS